MSRTIRNLIVFAAPLVVGIANLFHPLTGPHQPIYDTVHPVAEWWTVLHVLNLFGFAALGLAAYLLVLERHGIASTVAKAALLVFVPAYVGFDAVLGIGTGNLARYAGSLPVAQLPALKSAMQAFWQDDIATLLAILGSVAWTVAMGACAVSFTTARRGVAVGFSVLAAAFTGWGYSASLFGSLAWWISVGLIGAAAALLLRPAFPPAFLLLSGILLGTTHVVPFGPLGMAFFLAAAAISRAQERTSPVAALAASVRG